MFETHWAVDKDTGKLLSESAAQKAADNPFIWKWVVWMPKSEFPTVADALAAVAS